MRVLVAAESVGSLDAAAVAESVIRGWQRESADSMVARPLSDGGRGLLAAVAAGQPTTRHAVAVSGPDGATVPASFLMGEDGTAWVEAAQAAGSHLATGHRDPGRTTSRGVGQLLCAAVAAGALRVVIGVGGAGACDGGAGMLEVLGARAEPRAGLSRGGRDLVGLEALDVGPALALTSDVALEFATDSDVPLTGARGVARGFAAAEGADPQEVDALEQAMTAWAGLLGRAPSGRRVGIALGSGAGGGLGAALYRLGARRIPGIATALAAGGIEQQCADADLVLCTVESLDADSLRGSLLSAVAERAVRRALPVVVLARHVDSTRRQWITAGITAAFQLPHTHREAEDRHERGEWCEPDDQRDPDEPREPGEQRERGDRLEPGSSRSADRQAEACAAAVSLAAQRVARTWAR